jgi:hypothetical protein
MPEGKTPGFTTGGHGEVEGLGPSWTDPDGTVYLRCAGKYGHTRFDIRLLTPVNKKGKRLLEDVL